MKFEKFKQVINDNKIIGLKKPTSNWIIGADYYHPHVIYLFLEKDLCSNKNTGAEIEIEEKVYASIGYFGIGNTLEETLENLTTLVFYYFDKELFSLSYFMDFIKKKTIDHKDLRVIGHKRKFPIVWRKKDEV